MSQYGGQRTEYMLVTEKKMPNSMRKIIGKIYGERCDGESVKDDNDARRIAWLGKRRNDD